MNEPKESVIKFDLGDEIGQIETNAMLEFTPETVERLRRAAPRSEVNPVIVADEVQPDKAKKESKVGPFKKLKFK